MIANVDRRREPRLRYSWDGQVYTNHIRGGIVSRMIDLNSEGAAILMPHSDRLSTNEEIELGLLYPRIVNGSFNIIHAHPKATIFRSEWYNADLRRVVVRFNSPLLESPAIGNEYIYQ